MEMTLGGRIQTLRKQRGITQEELAKAMQVSTQAVSKCTKGAQSGNAAEHRMPCCYRGWQIISMFQLIICLEEENRSRKDHDSRAGRDLWPVLRSVKGDKRHSGKHQ